MDENVKTETDVDAVSAPEMEAAELPPAPDDVEELKPRKLSKMEIKKLHARQERRKRLINKGVPEEQVERVMMEEDYKALPLEKKFDLLKGTMVRMLKGFQEDLQALRHNDGVLADAMDVNLQAMARMLIEAGVSSERQKEVIDLVQQEIAEARKKKIEAKKEAQEKARAEAELKVAEAVKADEQAEVGATPEARVAEGATAFGEG